MRGAGAAAAITVALVLPATAVGHIVLDPPFVQAGAEELVSLQVPNERLPQRTIEVTATAPPGVTIVSANAPPGWLATVEGSTATWRGGTISSGAVVAFPIRIVARVRAGTYSLRSAQRYDDGATVRWASDLAVLPATGAAAPAEHPWGAIAAAVAGIVLIGSFTGLRVLRRKSLHEE